MATGYRINEFLTDIEQLTPNINASEDNLKSARKAINKRCKKEIEYLRSLYTLTSLRRAATDYRSAINARFDSGKTPLTTKTKDGKTTHIAYKYLTLKRSEKNEYKASEETRKDKYLSGEYRLVICNALEMVDSATQLLDSSSIYDMAAGLLLLTGRRPVEIMKTAKFTEIGENQVLFEGQAKTRNCENAKSSYKIYTLTDAQNVVKTLEKIRQHKVSIDKDLKNATERQINSFTSNALGKAVKRSFTGFVFKPENQNITKLSNYSAIEPKNLRAIYVHISHKKFAPLAVLDNYALNALGHVVKGVADNYMEFMLHPNETL